jgi:hypothetical protein
MLPTSYTAHAVVDCNVACFDFYVYYK